MKPFARAGLALVALGALGALAAAACSKEAPPPPAAPLATEAAAPVPSAAPSLASAAPSSEPVAVADASVAPAPSSSAGRVTVGTSTRLIDAGQPPRQKLRYTWHVEQKEQLVMDLRTTATTELAGAKQPEIPLPPVHIVLDLDPRSVTKDGDLRYDWRVSEAHVVADPQTPSPIAAGMRTEVSAIEHLAGSAVVTSRGVSAALTVDGGPTVDAGATGQMVEQIRQTLRDVAVPLPEEDVGRGARWQKISQLDAKGSHLTQTDTFTLLESTGATGAVDDVLAQTAPPQALRAPGMGAGAPARMESMLASGSAKTRFDLGRLVPQTKFDGTTTMVVSGPSAGDSTRRITMVMRVGIELQGKPR